MSNQNFTELCTDEDGDAFAHGHGRNRAEKDPFRDESHPMSNDVILRIIFEHTRRNDLKTCRLVCKRWNALTLPITRSTFEITIQTNDYPNHQDPKNIDNFIELMSWNKLGIPFGKYKLGPFCTTNGAGQKFLELCGNTIKELSFLYDLWDFTMENLSEILRSTPNLESFRIPTKVSSKSGNIVKLFSENSKPKLNFLKKFNFPLDPHFGRTDRFCSIFIDEIIPIAPNINEFIFPDISWVDESTRVLHCTTLQVLNLIDKLQRAHSIQTLYIRNVNTQHLQALQRMAAKPNGLKLKSLSFSFREPTVDIFKLILLFKHSLQRLFIDEDLTNILAFPTMPHLKWLGFHITDNFDSRRMNLKKIFPTLESLNMYWSLAPSDSNTKDELFPDSETCPKIKSFTLYQFYRTLNAFNQILNLFPNLNTLKLYTRVAGVEILRQIWTQLGQLEYLGMSVSIEGVESSVDLDSLLSGIPTQQGIQEISEEVKELEKMTRELRSNWILNFKNQRCTLPSIARLKKLKGLELCLHGEGSSGSGSMNYITNLSGYLALYTMKQLNHLKIVSCEFTKACCEILKEDLELEFWRFQLPLPGKKEIIPSNLKERSIP